MANKIIEFFRQDKAEKLIQQVENDPVLLERFTERFLQAAVAEEDIEPKADIGKYRSLSGAGTRDLSPLKFAQVREMAYYQWQRNPMASRIIQIMIDYCIGDELQIKPVVYNIDGEEVKDKSEILQGWSDDFYDDPDNEFANENDSYFEDALMNGEMVLPAGVNKTNGAVKLGYINPANVLNLKWDPNDQSKALSIECRMNTTESNVTKWFEVINVQSDPEKPGFGKLAGECFYFRANKLPSQHRGHSELLTILDWLDLSDKFVFDAAMTAQVRNVVLWVVKMIGKTEEQLKAERKKIKAPTGLDVKLVNEKTEWQAITPDLKSIDVANIARLLKNLVLAGKGYPEHWFADGGNTNLATAEVMSIPTMRMLKRKQRFVKSVYHKITRFIIDQGILHKRDQFSLADGEYYDVEITMFDFDKKDASQVAQAFQTMVTALTLASDKGWVRDEDIKKIVDGQLQRMGVDVDPSVTVEEIKADKKSKDDAEPYTDIKPGSFFPKKTTE